MQNVEAVRLANRKSGLLVSHARECGVMLTCQIVR